MWATFFSFIRYILELLWLFKIEILAGLFVGLTIYAYFYRILANREKSLTKSIKKINNIMTKINEVDEKKSEVRMILDTVGGFNESINNFRDRLEVLIDKKFDSLKEYFTNEINRTNKDVKEIKSEVVTMKEKAEKQSLIVSNQKTKLTLIVSIAVFFSSIIIGVVQYFILKALG